MASIIIAENAGETPERVQIQALEPTRTRRIHTRSSEQHVLKRFIFTALLDAVKVLYKANSTLDCLHFHIIFFMSYSITTSLEVDYIPRCIYLYKLDPHVFILLHNRDA
jgi:hypothetical protein